MILKYSKESVLDLIRLRAFIAMDNPENAKKVASKIIRSIEGITNTPLIGKRLSHYEDDVRELNIDRYVFRYLFEPNFITSLRSWHGKEAK